MLIKLGLNALLATNTSVEWLKHHLNMTASELVNSRRMVYAANLLVSSDMSVTEIAEACGIENKSYFFRLFKKHYGITPSLYRTANRRDPINP